MTENLKPVLSYVEVSQIKNLKSLGIPAKCAGARGQGHW